MFDLEVRETRYGRRFFSRWQPRRRSAPRGRFDRLKETRKRKIAKSNEQTI